MARKPIPKSQNGKGRVRVFFAEFEGDDETIQEGMRTLSAAVGKTFQPKVITLPATPQSAEQGQIGGGEVVADVDVVGEADPSLFDDEPEEPQEKSAPARPKRKPPTMSIVKDLDLRPDGKQSLRDFYEAKSPGSQEKQVALFVYYLQHTLGLDGITPKHVYTCFKDVQARVPKDLPQIIRNTASRGGWVDASDIQSVTITNPGENFVEHDLPETASPKS